MYYNFSTQAAGFHSGYVSGYVSGDGGGVLHGVPQLAEPEKSGYFVGDVVLAWTEGLVFAAGVVEIVLLAGD